MRSTYRIPAVLLKALSDGYSVALGRAQSFLPRLAEADSELQRTGSGGRHHVLDIENISDSEPHVEMVSVQPLFMSI